MFDCIGVPDPVNFGDFGRLVGALLRRPGHFSRSFLVVIVVVGRLQERLLPKKVVLPQLSSPR